MFHPSHEDAALFNLSALSGIAGSVSIACWIVVFSPQIIKNFRRQSTDGLSIFFIIIWLSGDLCNIVGGVLQGVLPTMLILAVYYALCDITLLSQCCYYRFWRDAEKPIVGGDDVGGERQPLIDADGDGDARSGGVASHSQSQPVLNDIGIPSANSPQETSKGSGSFSVLRRELSLVDGSHLSPAVPLVDESSKKSSSPISFKSTKKLSTFQSFLFNITAILLVVAVGVLGWWVSERLSHVSDTEKHDKHKHHDRVPVPIEYDTIGQVFGYFCATLYLSSRIPQLLLNYRRKSTEGVSVYLFLFACIGNTTYNISIFAHDISSSCYEGGAVGICTPGEARALYAKYIAVNASWIAGSLGTLLLDFGFFWQVFLYRKDDQDQEVAVADTE